MFPPLKNKSPICTKSIIVFLPPLPSLAFHISSMLPLLLPNPSTTCSTWSTIWRLNHICMNTSPQTTIYGGNFITQDCYEPSNLDGLDNDLLNLVMHEFSKSPTTNAKLMHWGVLWDIQTLEELIQGLILQHWMTMRQNMKQRFYLSNFPIPFPYRSIHLCQDWLWTSLYIQFVIFHVCTIFHIVFLPFLDPHIKHTPLGNAVALVFGQCISFIAYDFLFPFNQRTNFVFH